MPVIISKKKYDELQNAISRLESDATKQASDIERLWKITNNLTKALEDSRKETQKFIIEMKEKEAANKTSYLK